MESNCYTCGAGLDADWGTDQDVPRHALCRGCQEEHAEHGDTLDGCGCRDAETETACKRFVEVWNARRSW